MLPRTSVSLLLVLVLVHVLYLLAPILLLFLPYLPLHLPLGLFHLPPFYPSSLLSCHAITLHCQGICLETRQRGENKSLES